MTSASRNALRQVLKEAGENERFFDFSDGERLTWMIECAYELGRSTTTSPTVGRVQKPSPCLRNRQTSR
jgi:hypothetical protein